MINLPVPRGLRNQTSRQLMVNFSHLEGVGVSVSAKQLKGTVMCIP